MKISENERRVQSEFSDRKSMSDKSDRKSFIGRSHDMEEAFL